ncbi:hypothetical protein [Nodularia sp. NIES-3585]|uniref:hypothetical protein n=1 Tax=Nodularia sp. NIES-3585 TaxID=1973477 RepID=UPI000B5CF0C1|nr:hypothetical protein [Nodularia sp. NIES-3585]GAX36839.1 hypothetical protein NIES3585_28770 [Nodularia sp. NIES-3585]
MLKSTFKSITVICSSLAVVLTVCDSATAQLRINEDYPLPRGQESELLEFQRQNNQKMRQMRVMPNCSVGSGLGCNKTGTVVEKIINLSNGTNYQDMLMRSAGGEDNYRKFAAFYDHHPRLQNIPYASFWRNEDPSILDGHQYVLGRPVSSQPVSGLKAVTSNFPWSPLSRSGEISPREGLLNFKYSYGRILLEEVAKIPNLEEQIRSLDLPQEMTGFYLSNLSRGLRALNTGNNRDLRESILTILSYPYSPGTRNDGWYGRKLVDVPETIQSEEQPLSGDSFVSESPELKGEDISIALNYPSFEEYLLPSGGSLLPYAGIALLFWLLFMGGNGGSNQPASFVEVASDVIPSDVTPGNNDASNGFEFTGNIDVPPPQQPQVKTVPEPSTLTALLVLMLTVYILNYKQRLIKCSMRYKN